MNRTLSEKLRELNQRTELTDGGWPILDDAADTIESLQAEVEEARRQVEAHTAGECWPFEEYQQVKAEVEKLRGAAKVVVEAYDDYMKPMDGGGDSAENWSRIKAGIEAFRE